MYLGQSILVTYKWSLGLALSELNSGQEVTAITFYPPVGCANFCLARHKTGPLADEKLSLGKRSNTLKLHVLDMSQGL